MTTPEIVLKELCSVVPFDKYLPLSAIGSLYFAKFGKKITDQPGVSKVSKFVDRFPATFQVDKGNKILWLVKQLGPNDPLESVAVQLVPSTTSIPAAISLYPPATVHANRLPTKTVSAPRVLNDRSDVGVSLSELTASLHGQRSVVPLGGLAGFICAKKSTSLAKENTSFIVDGKMSTDIKAGSSILGFNSLDESSPGPEGSAVLINSADPFCAVCIGVQGAGKSHTMNVILENCMLNSVLAESCSIVSNPQPMCGLVLHYDQSESNCCEAVGLNSPAVPLSLFPQLKVPRLVVLASPTYFLQRKAFYGDTCEVIPLLFDWDTLTATQLKKLMRLSDSDTQLYVSVILNKLREYQRKNKIPSFDGFLEEVLELCNVSGQTAPLQQVKLTYWSLFISS